MTYVVTEKCIKCKYTDCVEVCPVDCFYEGPDMLVINPEECIDCGVCEPECPIEAIQSEGAIKDQAQRASIVEINQRYSKLWTNITEKKEPLPNAERHKDEPGKMLKYFKEALDRN
ncbi:MULTISPECIES: ferredoxin FdxA [unclassified Candidatus Lariskella]|uniref:ferredoxin FdxA n=1 Tax=unclassified Candidatus Lariskella TaxID=2632605 RepID=UPI0030D3AE24